jgi:ketosteroid isomerase-like protein
MRKAYDRSVDAEAAVHAWLEAWDQAWRAKDPDALANVYADEVAFRSHPFRDPQAPLDYAQRAFEDEGEELDLWWGDPIVDGNRATVEWWAVLTEDGELVTLAGTSILRFGADGLVVDQHDYWASTPGRIEPWPGWR